MLRKCDVCGFHECQDAEAFLLVIECPDHQRFECDDCYVKLHFNQENP